MRLYDNYLDTGNEWLPKVPQHWQAVKLKYCGLINPSARNYDFERTSDDLVVFLPMEKVSEDGQITQDSRREIQQVITGFTYFERNDILVAKITPCFENGKGALLKNLETNFGFGSTEFHVLRPTERIAKEFLFYITRTDLFKRNGEALMTGSAGQKRVPQNFIEQLLIGLPPLEEQTAITNYLDEKTAQIDTLIEKKQKLIELLKEERKAIINEAVSGEGKNWERKKLKYVADRIQTGSTPPSNEEQYFTEEFNWYTPSDFSDSLLLLSSRRKISLEAIKDGVAKVFPENSVLFVGIGATIGKVGYILSPASSNQQINCISFKTKEMAIFYCYWFYAKQNEIIAGANAATLPILNQSQMKDVVVPVPDSTEGIQKTIDQIFKEVTRIEKTIANIGSELALLTEYKTVLISEVVTGKVKVV